MKQKEAIAVYNPTDQVERAVQESYHSTSGEWLGAYQCRMIAHALTSLKCSDNWIENPELIEHRVSYFFAPFMCRDKSVVIFPTYPLFLRDILENCEINAYLHDPITFVTRPLAHYLCREYPIHIYVDAGKLKGYNAVSWVDLGGLLIANENITFEPDAIERIQCKEVKYTDMVERVLSDITKSRETWLSKVAISQIAPGVFISDRHEREIEPDVSVWDKELRTKCLVSKVEAGETGLVAVLYDDGQTVTIPKADFDCRYVIG